MNDFYMGDVHDHGVGTVRDGPGVYNLYSFGGNARVASWFLGLSGLLHCTKVRTWR